MQPLGKVGASDKYLDKKFWLDSSDRLMYEGKAPELADTQAARMPAFFEHSNVNFLSMLEALACNTMPWLKEERTVPTHHTLTRQTQLNKSCTALVNVQLWSG